MFRFNGASKLGYAKLDDVVNLVGFLPLGSAVLEQIACCSHQGCRAQHPHSGQQRIPRVHSAAPERFWPAAESTHCLYGLHGTASGLQWSGSQATNFSTSTSGRPDLTGPEMSQPADRPQPADPPHKVFSGPWMKQIAFVVRLKSLQLVATGAAAFPLLLHLRGGAVDSGELVASGLLTATAAIASYAMWFYSQRYVGVLALQGEQQGVVTISVLDFWGHREDLSFRVGDITPPFLGKPPHQVAQLCSQMFLPLDLKAADRQFLLAIRHGTIHDKQALMALLDGTLQKQAHDLSAAATVPGDHVTQRLNADKPLQP